MDEHEPIFWTSTRQGFNKADRERVSFVEGRKIVERVPQRGHQGEWENRRPMRGIRSIPILRFEGHVVELVLTCGAAHNDHNTDFGQMQRAKMRHNGWFHMGACPLALIISGELDPDKVVARSILGGQPCAPGSCSSLKPCSHAIAERDARRESWASSEKVKATKYVDPTDKVIEANTKNAEALTAAVVAAVSGVAERPKRKVETEK